MIAPPVTNANFSLSSVQVCFWRNPSGEKNHKPVDTPHILCHIICGNTTGGVMKLDLLQGTLDLMVLQTLASMGALNGYRLARRIEQLSGNEVLLNQGTIY